MGIWIDELATIATADELKAHKREMRKYKKDVEDYRYKMKLFDHYIHLKEGITDWWSYLKLIGGILLTSPLFYTGIRLDQTYIYSLITTLIVYGCGVVIGILGMNYLETGSSFKSMKLIK